MNSQRVTLHQFTSPALASSALLKTISVYKALRREEREASVPRAEGRVCVFMQVCVCMCVCVCTAQKAQLSARRSVCLCV